MKYIIYCTVCTLNGKIYIGVHKTENEEVFDGYIGCGIDKSNHYYILHPKTTFHKAVKKYGYNKFKRHTLMILDDETTAYLKEAELVTEQFIKQTTNYNTCLGGKGGGNFSNPKQYDLKGNFIKSFLSVKEICEELNLRKSSVDDAMSRKKPLKGYYFISNGSIGEIIKSNLVNSVSYDLWLSSYNPETLEIIESFRSLKFTAKKINCDSRTLKNAIVTSTIFKDCLWQYGVDPIYKGKTERIARQIDQYDLQGNYIKTWRTLAECAKEHPKVRDVLKGVRNHTHGFIFKFKN